MRTLTLTHLVPALLLTTSGMALAQNSITVPMEVEHNSNPSLTPGGDSVVRYRVSPQYTLRREHGTAVSAFSFGGVLERSSDTRLSANRSDPNIRYRLDVSAPTSVLTLNASLEEESSRAAEFEEAGLVTEDSTLRRGMVGARWAKQLSERTGLDLAGGYTRLSYETPVLIGYSEVNAEAVYRWQPAEGSRFELAGTAARLDPNDDTERSSRQGLMLSHERVLSPSFTARAGLGTVKTTGVRRGRDTVGLLRLVYTGERVGSDIEWSREVAPSGTIGGYALSQSLRWGLSYPLTESTSFTAGAARVRSLDIDSSTGQSVSLGTRTELSTFWSMSLRFEHLRSTSAAGVTARSNSVGVGLVYSHPDF